MRVGLVLYGKRRDLDKCEPSWQSFKRVYVPDIFYHGWGNTYISELLNGSDTKAFSMNQDLDFSTLHRGIDQYSSSAKNVLPQTFSIRQSDRSRTDYERITDQYDWVIRSRFDLSLHAPTSIPLDTLNPNYLYVCANHWPGANPMYDDNIMMGNSYNMAKVSSELFNFAIDYIKITKLIPSGEQLLAEYLRRSPTPVIKTDCLNFTLGRDLQ